MGTGVRGLLVAADLTSTADVCSVVLLACIGVQVALILLNLVWLVRGEDF